MAQSFFKFVKGILLRGETSDPSDNLNGSLWYNSTSNKVKGYIQSAVRELLTADQTQTITNKTIDADSNTISNIDNNEIKAAAAIALDKLAATTVSRVLQSDASGFVSASSVTSTTLTYLDATSSIQGQLNGKEPTITVLPESKGGTNQSTYATGDLLYASGSNTLAKRSIGTAGQVLTVSGGVPTWAAPGGSSGFSVTTISSNVTLTDLTKHLVDTTVARTLTLPTPANGIQIIVKDKSGSAATNNITIQRAGSESIDGVAASYVISTNYAAVEFVSDGTNWFVL